MTEEEDLSQVKVCNEALFALKHLKPMTSMELEDGDNDTGHRLCVENFGAAMKGVLRAFDWPFARAYSTVYATPGAAFPPPLDAVRVISLANELNSVRRVPFTIYDGMIHPAAPARFMVYTALVEDIGRWDTLAREALVARVAALVAEPLTGRTQAWQRMEQTYARVMAEAKLAAAREQSTCYLPPDAPDYSYRRGRTGADRYCRPSFA